MPARPRKTTAPASAVNLAPETYVEDDVFFIPTVTLTFRAALERAYGNFTSALHLAAIGETILPLMEHLASVQPLTLSPSNKQELAGYIRSLAQRITALEARPIGRPRRNPETASAIERAERGAVWQVTDEQRRWRKDHNRKRVPSSETNKMIDKAAQAMAETFHLPKRAITRDAIRRHLKTGRQDL
jgi:hypothetical protein